MNFQLEIKKIKSNNFIKNVFGIGIYKVLGVISNFLLVGLIFRYFSSEELNGIWLTIFSIISWMAVFDFGIGNGLRNKLTESISQGNMELAKKYIATTYVIMLIPIIVIILIALLTVYSIDWINIFNINNSNISNSYLSAFILTIVILYAINFYLTIVYAILHATFQSYKTQMIQFFVNVSNILLISFLHIFTETNDLIILGVFYIGTSIIILSFTTFYIFQTSNKEISASIKHFDKLLIKDILGIGIKFLVLQLSIVVLFNTDNLIISSFIGVSEVTGYQLVNKILSIYTIILSIILTPLWTLIIQLKNEANSSKIKNVFKKMILLISFLSIAVCLTCLIIPEIILLWVGDTVSSISTLLITLMGIFTIIHMWCNTFQAILNGMNQLIIQVLAYGSALIINIPISIWLVTNTNLGVSGVILGTIISLIIPAILLPIYTFRKIKNLKS